MTDMPIEKVRKVCADFMGITLNDIDRIPGRILGLPYEPDTDPKQFMDLWDELRRRGHGVGVFNQHCEIDTDIVGYGSTPMEALARAVAKLQEESNKPKGRKAV